MSAQGRPKREFTPKREARRVVMTRAVSPGRRRARRSGAPHAQGRARARARRRRAARRPGAARRSSPSCAPDARIVAVGKRGGCRSTPQAFIEQLMIREARAGSVVGAAEGRRSVRVRTRRRGAGGASRRGHRRRSRARHHVGARGAGVRSAMPVTHRACAHGVALVTGARGGRRRGARLARARRVAA